MEDSDGYSMDYESYNPSQEDNTPKPDVSQSNLEYLHPEPGADSPDSPVK